MNRKQRRAATPQDKQKYAITIYNDAVTLQVLRRYDDALALYEKAIALKPAFAEAYNNRAFILRELHRYDDALASSERAIAVNPQAAEAYNNRGLILRDLHRYDDALVSYDRAIALNPASAETFNDRGLALRELHRYDDALASYDRAITLNPAFAEAYNNRANILWWQLHRYDDALAGYDRAITLNPDYPDPYFSKGLLKLLLGEYEEGWKLYEYRWHCAQQKQYRRLHKPLWLGEPLAGKTILLHAEQGFGDIIQLCRYIPQVERRGATVILQIRAPLIGLLSTLKASFRIMKPGEALPDFDLHCPLFSLPLAFGTSVSTIPSDVPYLFADPTKLKTFKDRLGKEMRPRIGLAWSGSATHADDHNRSIALNTLAPILQANVEFHSLQKELRPEDAKCLENHTTIISHPDFINDFADTAALISQMDIVISVDTSVAHLAGALGKPVWILLPFTPDWRWMTEREDSPWYPTARLFRQPRPGDWKSVIEAVNLKLLNMAGEF